MLFKPMSRTENCETLLVRSLPLIVCAMLITAGGARAQQPLPTLVLKTPDQIGYSSPAQALAALRARPDVAFSEQRGWTMAEDLANRAIWSFVPPEDPAYPAVVRRRVVQQGTAVFVDAQLLCGATKPACDALLQEFQQLNKAARRDFH